MSVTVELRTTQIRHGRLARQPTVPLEEATRLTVEQDPCISPGALTAHDANLGIDFRRRDIVENLSLLR